ncbi:hypothetical protein ABID22_000264 [Pontibacter aydingkolensis]|uniref:SpoIIAA-like n=1 Tax=Pontibacter aydingkolensis TaxID=1911536 RepID=A0ABS7CQG1_9BACT|nr:hypothetical protein [Pontibacter aydingkolensis]MBW7466070.1 hypothetical protein [Pontibacter aydingkolensis]
MFKSIDSQNLKKANGDVFIEIHRAPDNAFLHVNWIGIQSLETIMMGGNQILSMLRVKPCQGLLNSNRELIGSWESAVNWLSYRWAPQAEILGLRNFAHVISPGIYGQWSFDALYPKIKGIFEVQSFLTDDAAKAWLQLKSS